MPNTESETDECKIQIYECNSHPIDEATELRNFHFSRMNSNSYRRIIQGKIKLHTTIYSLSIGLTNISLPLSLWLRFNHFEIKSSISSVPILFIPLSFEQCQTLSMMMTYYFSAKTNSCWVKV